MGVSLSCTLDGFVQQVMISALKVTQRRYIYDSFENFDRLAQNFMKI